MTIENTKLSLAWERVNIKKFDIDKGRNEQNGLSEKIEIKDCRLT